MSPTQRVTSPVATNTGQSGRISPTYRCPGTSAAVITRSTPGIERAADGSIDSTRARGWRLMTAAAWSIPSISMSATYGLSPNA